MKLSWMFNQISRARNKTQVNGEIYYLIIAMCKLKFN